MQTPNFSSGSRGALVIAQEKSLLTLAGGVCIITKTDLRGCRIYSLTTFVNSGVWPCGAMT